MDDTGITDGVKTGITDGIKAAFDALLACITGFILLLSICIIGSHAIVSAQTTYSEPTELRVAPTFHGMTRKAAVVSQGWPPVALERLGDQRAELERLSLQAADLDAQNKALATRVEKLETQMHAIWAARTWINTGTKLWQMFDKQLGPER